MNHSNIGRREFVKSAAAFSLSAAQLRARSKGAESPEPPPNIVLIMADDLGHECIGAYGGSSYSTPVLDQLANEGLRFDHCYSQPLCTPSRVQLMTGMYNVRNYEKFGVLPENQITFANFLRQAGYATCVTGKWQLGRQIDSPRIAGFDEYCLWQHTRGRIGPEGTDSRYPNPSLEINGQPREYDQGEYAPDIVSDFACEFFERNQNQPFLLYYPMILTHCPFSPTPDSEDWDRKSKGSETYKGEVRYFRDMVTYMDKIVGKIVTKLGELDLLEKTLLLFTGDNGTDEPVVSRLRDRWIAGAKGTMTDAGTHVPLIASWPGHMSGGRASSDLVDFSDFFPTLCQISGAPIPDNLKIDGNSFLPTIRGEKGPARPWIYSWFSRDGIVSSAREFARTQRYKLYRTGQFYDLLNDSLEERDLQHIEHGQEASRTKEMLQKVLDQYANARPYGLEDS